MSNNIAEHVKNKPLIPGSQTYKLDIKWGGPQDPRLVCLRPRKEPCPCVILTGVSREHICGSRVGGAQERTLWPSQISVCPQMYNFTSFTVSLNELQTGMEKILAPTDCRLRPDIRSMENGNMGV